CPKALPAASFSLSRPFPSSVCVRISDGKKHSVAEDNAERVEIAIKLKDGREAPLHCDSAVSVMGALTLPAGMRADDALDLLAAALALLLFALGRTEFGERRPVLLGAPVLPTSYGAKLCLGAPVPAAKEADVSKPSGYYSVQASFAEPV